MSERCKPKYLIANLVYGQVYTNLFVNHHLKALLDPSNLPSIKNYDVYYTIFTDDQTLSFLKKHPYMLELAKHAVVDLNVFGLREDVNAFGERYTIQNKTLQASAQMAKDLDAIFSYWTADQVVAKDFFQCLEHMDKHDAVLTVPMRACAESLSSHFNRAKSALSATELFQLAYANMHPLWVASHWEAPQFTRMPYTILWNTGHGLVARSFSISPVVVRPNERLIALDNVPDSEVSILFENPYWAKDWTEVPMIGAEPLICFYPPWKNSRAEVGEIREWLKHLKPDQVKNFKAQFYFPSQETVGEVDTTEVMRALLEVE